MIIKGQARGRARQLAAHLLRTDENERVHIYECRGTLAKDAEGALIEMEARSLAARTQKPLYHASISPEPGRLLKDDQIRRAVDHLEERLGLHGQPRIVVLHQKKQREHIHVVWSRIEAESGASIPYSWNYRIHEQASRELEVMFGHRAVAGSRTPRRARATKEYELRQAERSGIPRQQVSDELTALWQQAGSAEEFRRRLKEQGYTLARGDRRAFVVIDRAGEVHSLARRIRGVNTAAVRERLADIGDLPDVKHAREAIRVRATISVPFDRAAREVTRPRPFRQVMQPRAGRIALPSLEQFLYPNPPGAPAPPARIARPRVASTQYHSLRAILVAEFASRIAAARRHAPRDELDAALAALYVEREAALVRLGAETRGRPDTSYRKRRIRRHRLRTRRRPRLIVPINSKA